MEALLVRIIPIAENLKTGQKYTCKPSTEGSSRLLSRWDSEQLDWCPDGTPVHITSTSEKPNTSSENKFQTIAQKKRTTPSAFVVLASFTIILWSITLPKLFLFLPLQDIKYLIRIHPNLNPVIRPFTFVAQKTYRLHMYFYYAGNKYRNYTP